MNSFDRRRYEMLTRVRDFGVTYGHLFPDSSLAPKAFTVITEAVADIERRDVAATTASAPARARRRQDARQALRDRLVPLVRTAQSLSGADATFRSQFVLPTRIKDQQLLAIGREYVQRVAGMEPQFVAHGLPPTFAEDLQPLLTELDAALRDRGMSRDQLVQARAGIRQALANAFTALWQLDIIVTNHLAADPVVGEVWRRSRRIAYPARRRQVTVEEPTPADVSPLAPATGNGAGAERSPSRGTDSLAPSLRLARTA